MYLGNMRSHFKGYGVKLPGWERKEYSTDEELRAAWRAYKEKGDNTNELGQHFIRLALKIASYYARRFPGYINEVMSEALDAIPFGLEQSKIRMYDDNIYPYMSSVIHSQVSKYVTIHRKIVRTPYEAEYHGYTVSLGSVMEDEDNIEYGNDSESTLVPPVENDFEFITQDMIDVFEEPDNTIVRLLYYGYSQEEIAEQIGYTRQNVNLRLQNIRQIAAKKFGVMA